MSGSSLRCSAAPRRASGAGWALTPIPAQIAQAETRSVLKLKCAPTKSPTGDGKSHVWPNRPMGAVALKKPLAWYGFFQRQWEKPKPRKEPACDLRD